MSFEFESILHNIMDEIHLDGFDFTVFFFIFYSISLIHVCLTQFYK